MPRSSGTGSARNCSNESVPFSGDVNEDLLSGVGTLELGHLRRLCRPTLCHSLRRWYPDTTLVRGTHEAASSPLQPISFPCLICFPSAPLLQQTRLFLNWMSNERQDHETIWRTCLFVLRAATCRVMFGPSCILLVVAAASAVCQKQPRHFDMSVVARANLLRCEQIYATNTKGVVKTRDMLAAQAPKVSLPGRVARRAAATSRARPPLLALPETGRFQCAHSVQRCAAECDQSRPPLAPLRPRGCASSPPLLRIRAIISEYRHQ